MGDSYIYHPGVGNRSDGSKLSRRAKLQDKCRILLVLDIRESIEEERNRAKEYLKKLEGKVYVKDFDVQKNIFFLPQNEDKRGDLEKLMLDCLKEDDEHKEYNKKLLVCLEDLERCFQGLVKVKGRVSGEEVLDLKRKLYVYADSFSNYRAE